MKNYAVHIPWVVVVTRVASNCSEWTYSECGSILRDIVYRCSTSRATASRVAYLYIRHIGKIHRMSYVQCVYRVTRLAL